MSRDEDTPTDIDPTSHDDTDEDPKKIRLPTKLEVAQAVESTPTVEDSQKPDMQLPAYLAPSARTIELNIDESVDEETAPTERVTRPPGFTDRANTDPTELEMPKASLSADVIERPEASEAKPFPWMVVAAVVVVVVVGAVIALS